MPDTGVHDMVKSAEVSLAPGPHPVTDRAALDPAQGVYIRNQLPGTVTDVATVKIPVEGGEVTSAITADSATGLALTAGTTVVALMKATEVSPATT